MAVELKIDLLEAAFRCCFDCIFLAVDFDVLRAVKEGLTPNADKNFLEVKHFAFLNSNVELPNKSLLSCIDAFLFSRGQPKYIVELFVLQNHLLRTLKLTALF
jgi:hypothetical protein